MHQNKPLVDIAFCCDKHMLPGLHVTIASLLSTFDRNRSLRLFWLHDGVSEIDLLNVQRTVSLHDLDVSLQAIEHNVEHRKQFTSLHGSFFPYARLDLAQILSSRKVLYLDSDLIIGTDLSMLYDYDLIGNVLGAPWESGVVGQALDADFLSRELNIPRDTPYFNSGVLLIDLLQWRENQIDKTVDILLEKYGSDCVSHDQSILNILFGNSFTKLPGHYNLEVYAHDRPRKRIEGCVAHLTGLPKPWDPFGGLNTYSRIWKQASAIAGVNKQESLTGKFDWSRFVTIFPSLAKLAFKKMSPR